MCSFRDTDAIFGNRESKLNIWFCRTKLLTPTFGDLPLSKIVQNCHYIITFEMAFLGHLYLKCVSKLCRKDLNHFDRKFNFYKIPETVF